MTDRCDTIGRIVRYLLQVSETVQMLAMRRIVPRTKIVGRMVEWSLSLVLFEAQQRSNKQDAKQRFYSIGECIS